MAGKRRAKITIGPGAKKYRSEFEARVGFAIVEGGAAPRHEERSFLYTKMYKLDFAPYRKTDGEALFIEAKGYFPVEDRVKVLAVLKEHSFLRANFWIVFQRPNMKVTKTLTAMQWCAKHNINACGIEDVAGLLR